MKRLFHGMLTQAAVRTAETRLYGAAASRGKGNWQGAGLMGCVSTLVSSAPLSPKACECMGQSVPNWGSAGLLSYTSYELLQRAHRTAEVGSGLTTGKDYCATADGY